MISVYSTKIFNRVLEAQHLGLEKLLYEDFTINLKHPNTSFKRLSFKDLKTHNPPPSKPSFCKGDEQNRSSHKFLGIVSNFSGTSSNVEFQ